MTSSRRNLTASTAAGKTPRTTFARQLQHPRAGIDAIDGGIGMSAQKFAEKPAVAFARIKTRFGPAIVSIQQVRAFCNVAPNVSVSRQR